MHTGLLEVRRSDSNRFVWAVSVVALFVVLAVACLSGGRVAGPSNSLEKPFLGASFGRDGGGSRALLDVGGKPDGENAGCKTDLDCSLLGRCDVNRGSCVCSSGWTGKSCATADLLPLNTSHGYQNVTHSSWGG